MRPVRPALLTRRGRLCFVAFVLTFLSLLSWLFSLPADASEAESREARRSTTAHQTAAARLAERLEVSAATIDLSDLGLPIGEIGGVYAAVLQAHPGLFYVAPRVAYAYVDTEEGRIVTTVYPTYTLADDDLVTARALYMDTIDEFLDALRDTFGDRPRHDAEVTLFLHDRLADRYDYDTRVYDPSTAAEANSDAYRLFRDGVGICQAYALAYMALCRAAGLEADMVVSPAMNHAWNHVRVEGVWYHVDVTRDDPIPAPGGTNAVTHDRFLRSDDGMVALGYSDFSCAAGHTPQDTRYEWWDAQETGQYRAVLSGHCIPLTPVATTPDRPLVWVGMIADSADADGCVGNQLAAYCFIDGNFSRLSTGDMDGDGTVTPRDLLSIRNFDLPETYRTAVRHALVYIDERDQKFPFNPVTG